MKAKKLSKRETKKYGMMFCLVNMPVQDSIIDSFWFFLLTPNLLLLYSFSRKEKDREEDQHHDFRSKGFFHSFPFHFTISSTSLLACRWIKLYCPFLHGLYRTASNSICAIRLWRILKSNPLVRGTRRQLPFFFRSCLGFRWKKFIHEKRGAFIELTIYIQVFS